MATALEWADIGLRRIADKFAATGHTFSGDSLQDLIRSLDTHVGAPSEVIESLAADPTLNRVTDISFQVHSVDPPHDLILRSLELIASEVAPALGWRDQPTTPRIAIAR
ncbi:putative FMN-dependent luciferase-like monooxygenase [compost metagenome]